MIEKNIVATQPVETAGKANYPTVIVHYTRDDGKPGKIGNFAAKLDAATRAKLKSIVAGTKLSIKIEKNDETGYWNLISAGEPVTETSANTSGGRLSDVDKGKGAQRGNALTNAVNLVVAFGGKINLETALELVATTAPRLLDISDALENPNTITYSTANTAPTTIDDVAPFDTATADEVTNELGW